MGDGRYVLLEKVGRGGMGVVYESWDRELQRRVAIKLLNETEGRAEPARERLKREAQALARVGSENVVAVYDVGLDDGRVFVAMEYVEGRTLGRWSVEEHRSVHSVLDAFLDAGRGLSSAHAVGLVHGDFKPDNVLVAEDGKVFVIDFGLARPLRQAPSTDESPVGGAPGRDRSTLSFDGGGTVEYAAPELFQGGKADAKSDQFAFCVSLFQVLVGHLPNEEPPSAENRTGRSFSSLPRWLRAAIERGLRAEPEQRWPVLEDLLAALDYRSHRRRRLGWLATGVALSMVVLGAFSGSDARAEPFCDAVDPSVASIWDQRSEEIKVVFDQATAPFAADSWADTQRFLDNYSREWDDARAELCASLRAREVEREAFLDGMECLSGRLERVAQALAVLATFEASELRGVDGLLDELPTSGACLGPQPTRCAAERGPWAARLDHAWANAAAGRLHSASSIVDELKSSVGFQSDARLRAETLLLEARILRKGDRFEEAQSALAKAIGIAQSIGCSVLAEQAARIMVEIYASNLGEHRAAKLWLEFHGGVVESMGAPRRGTAYRAELRGLVEQLDGRMSTASAEYLGASEDLAASLGASHRETIRARLKYADSLAYEGNLRESDRIYEDLLERRTARVGDWHPDIAIIYANMADNALARGESELAVSRARKALTIQTSVDTSSVAERSATEAVLAQALYQQGLEMQEHGHNDAAEGVLEDAYKHAIVAMDGVRGRLDERHTDYLKTLRILSMIQPEVGRFRDAVESNSVLFESSLLESERDIFAFNAAYACSRLGDYPEAKQWLSRLDELPHRPDLDIYVGLTRVAIALGLEHCEEARAGLEIVRSQAPADDWRVIQEFELYKRQADAMCPGG